MQDPRPDNVQPVPDLAEVPVREEPAATPDPAGERPADPPAEDSTLPAEG